MRYGELPTELGIWEVVCKEMLFYQYLPIKMPGHTTPKFEERLSCFTGIVGSVCCDFIGVYGLDRFIGSHVYLTAKFMWQHPHTSYNRMGWHSDGFMTDDINYVWSDRNSTVFNCSDFKLTMDDEASMEEMNLQAIKEFDIIYKEGALLRLNQYNIHKVSDCEKGGMRTFLKISFSADRYDLIGNSHNYLIDYNWEMKLRKEARNIPQSKQFNHS